MSRADGRDPGGFDLPTQEIDLTGRVCPYPVVEVVRAVERMDFGETVRFLVDDPLAVKSIPEELEEIEDARVSISKERGVWLVVVERG